MFAVLIIFSQICGAGLGCLFSCASQTFTEGQVRPGVAMLCPPKINDNPVDCDPENMKGQIFFAEMIGTFFFVAFILSIKYYNGANDDIVNALGVSSVLYA